MGLRLRFQAQFRRALTTNSERRPTTAANTPTNPPSGACTSPRRVTFHFPKLQLHLPQSQITATTHDGDDIALPLPAGILLPALLHAPDEPHDPPRPAPDHLLPATATASAAAAPEELFHNKTLNKRLSLADAREVLEFMRKDGRAEALPASTDVFWVYWRTPDEWAAVIEGWIDETAQKGVVLTLYELTEGEGTRGRFHGLDPDLLAKALQILVKRGKAQIFGQEDSQGVKFF
ncbi:vacuolar protein-sorting-associated protein 25 [Colletotrichum liriopes]|uniref:ESCRT-II complex subunit VPS25 n=1 Tax=Colletotrichum liriopes TaxID=708192 RepID=A0AA37GYM2_9PEZI|nr:vacuolar protein-sorting-associated protein 25 [Colletotrichum liriopes]